MSNGRRGFKCGPCQWFVCVYGSDSVQSCQVIISHYMRSLLLCTQPFFFFFSFSIIYILLLHLLFSTRNFWPSRFSPNGYSFPTYRSLNDFLLDHNLRDVNKVPEFSSSFHYLLFPDFPENGKRYQNNFCYWFSK